MPYSSSAYLWPSWLETSPPMSQPPAAYFSYPRVSVIRVCQRSATFQKLTSGKPASGPGKPNPGRDGTITSNASAGSPPNAAGSASGSITFDQCQNVHGQPWVRINGIGRGPTTGLAHEVHRDAGDAHPVVLVGVDGGLGLAPVEAAPPVGNQLLRR